MHVVHEQHAHVANLPRTYDSPASRSRLRIRLQVNRCAGISITSKVQLFGFTTGVRLVKMNVFDVLDDARGWANGIAEDIQGFLPEASADKADTGTELWGAASPKLQKALIAYEKKESGSLADTAWFGESKASCQKDLDEIIDTVILVLETSGASQCRAKIRTRLKAIDQSRERICRLREESLSAPPLASLITTSSLWTRSCERLEAMIAAEELSIKVVLREIGQLKLQFSSHLREIGLTVSPEEVDSLVLPVHYGIVAMVTATVNVGRLTAQMERLVDESSESPANTRRYYGIYVLLVYAVDRLQQRFIEEIDGAHLPNLRSYEQEARLNIADAQTQLRGGGPKTVLAANIAAGSRAIEACHRLAESLSKQRASVAAENLNTRQMLAAAMNTYKTVRLSLNVAELMSDCREAYRALRQLKIPHLRPYQDLRLKEELHQLAERMSDRET